MYQSQYKVFVINYNLPQVVDSLYYCLSKSIKDNDIYILDNGSDKMPPHTRTKIFIEKNIKVSGAFRKIFDFSIENDIQNVIVITTSAILVEDENYHMKIVESLKYLSEKKWSTIYSNILSTINSEIRNIPHQVDVDNWICNPAEAQPIMTIWNLDYIKEIKNLNHSWYNRAYVYGWGAAYDGRMYNITSGWQEWTSPHIKIGWNTNITYKSNMGEISLLDYQSINKVEEETEFRRKFNLSAKKIKKFVKSQRLK